MTGSTSRRTFLEGMAALGAAAVATRPAAAAARVVAPPVVIASANGWRGAGPNPLALGSAVEITMERLRDAALAARRFALLEALVDGVAEVENDPADHSVGIGGLPNEDGVVQLDASLMHGPTHRCGAVAALENIQNPARVAMLVLRYTDHSFLVGPGAYRFARAHGLPHQDLLTDEARRIWLYWKQRMSERDDWVHPADDEVEEKVRRAFTHGTIHLSALDQNRDLAGVTSTSGLSYKIAGRVGDSPIIGAGLYTDNDVGSAGATGRGEEAIANCASFAVVEAMRAGLLPREACLAVLQRVVERARRRGLVKDGRPTFELTLYALRKDGAYGSAQMGEGGSFAVIDGAAGARHEPCAWLFDR